MGDLEELNTALITKLAGAASTGLETYYVDATADNELKVNDADANTTLTAIKDTDGIKKITDALPSGTNTIGSVKITDGVTVAGVDAANAQYVSGKSAVGVAPSSNPVAISGVDGGGLKRAILTDTSGRVATLLLDGAGASITVGQKTMANSIPVVLPSDQTVSVTFADPTTPTDYNITMTAANTEYSQALPANTKKFEFRCRNYFDVRWSFTTGKVATPTAPYNTLSAGGFHWQDGVNLSSKTLYFACGIGLQVVELKVWT